METAWRALTAPSFVAHKADVLRDGGRVVSRDERADGGLVMSVSRELPDGAPSMVQRFLPADGRVVQTDEWSGPAGDGVRRGTWRVAADGVPARLEGSMRLEPADGGCAYVVEGTVTVQVPLVGGKAEKLLSDMTEQLAGKEAELLRALLVP